METLIIANLCALVVKYSMAIVKYKQVLPMDSHHIDQVGAMYWYLSQTSGGHRWDSR